MPQPVRADPCRVDPREHRTTLDHVPERLTRECRAAHIDEQQRIGTFADQRRTRRGEVAVQPVLRFVTQRHQPVTSSFSGHTHRALAQVERGRRQVDQFAHAQAGGVHQLEHRAVAQAGGRIDVGRGQQRLDLAFRQRLGQ